MVEKPPKSACSVKYAIMHIINNFVNHFNEGRMLRKQLYDFVNHFNEGRMLRKQLYDPSHSTISAYICALSYETLALADHTISLLTSV